MAHSCGSRQKNLPVAIFFTPPPRSPPYLVFLLYSSTFRFKAFFCLLWGRCIKFDGLGHTNQGRPVFNREAISEKIDHSSNTIQTNQRKSHKTYSTRNFCSIRSANNFGILKYPSWEGQFYKQGRRRILTWVKSNKFNSNLKIKIASGLIALENVPFSFPFQRGRHFPTIPWQSYFSSHTPF